MKKLSLVMLSCSFLAAGLVPSAASAKIKTESFEYKHGDAVLEGFIAYDDAITGKRPGVLVVHEWKGPNPYQKKRAEELAAQGYVAFAIDMYGKGIRPTTHEEAAKLSGMYRQDRKLMRARIGAALDRFKQHAMLDASKIGAIGFCFGGTTVIELARSGADVKGIVSFHGGLDSPNPADGKNIKGKVLVLHGADDQFVPAEDIAKMQKEFRDAKVDWQMIYYGGAVHSFTVPDAGNDPSKGMAFSPDAARRSNEAMLAFFREVFGKK